MKMLSDFNDFALTSEEMKKVKGGYLNCYGTITYPDGSEYNYGYNTKEVCSMPDPCACEQGFANTMNNYNDMKGGNGSISNISCS